MKTFNKILIANRGEIAVRIIKSAKKLGIKTVAIYSEPDAEALHVAMADEAYQIGKIELSDTYLNIDKIIALAKKTNSEAIHPGYGFLSENPEFAEECEKNGIIFIGPNSKAIRLMGNKIEARNFVKKLGVPITPGLYGEPETLLKASREIPFPLLVKAAAGGGGKAMRIVYNEKELQDALEASSREAKAYFKDGTIYIEKFIEEPRHIEIQIIGDNYGNVVHLFERECSVQRRYQKIIEETPSPTINDEIRWKMGEEAVKIGKATGYNNAGTIEFLVDKDLNYYFLEANTRVQVEHPVTEMVTGIDIVSEQIMIAAGNKLSLEQDKIKQNGHSIECRIYAEDPANNFLPSPGKMTYYSQPEGADIRIDTYITKPTTIQSFYDPMICKLIVWAETREKARNKMISALKNFIIHGIKTNISYLVKLLQHEAYINNTISTKFCDDHTAEIISDIQAEKDKINPAIPCVAYLLYDFNKDFNKIKTDEHNVWKEIRYWRNYMNIPMKISAYSDSTERSDKEYYVKINKITGSRPSSRYELGFLNTRYFSSINSINPSVSGTGGKIEFNLTENGKDIIYTAYVSQDEKGNGFVSYDGHIFNVKRADILTSEIIFKSKETFGENLKNIVSPMPGKVIKIKVKEGDRVKKGDVLCVVEAMKMENNLIATKDAIIEKINVKVGELIDGSVPLIVLGE